MMRAKFVATVFVAALAVCLFVRDAQADCAPPPVPVPGLSGPPVWLPPTPGSTAWRAQLQDPRWAAGPVHAFAVHSAGATQQQALYRFVYSSNNLYVSIQALADADGIDGIDGVYFGITEGTGGAGAHMFYIQLDTGSPASPCAGVFHDPAPAPCPVPNSGGTITYYRTLDRTLSPPTWTAQPVPPAWLKNVATWGANTPNVAWAVTFQIDVTGPGITGATNMFFGTGIQMAAGTVLYLTSSSQPSVLNPAIGPGIPAGRTITDWSAFDPLGNACPPGITISSNSVGVLSGGSLTSNVNTCPIPPNPPGTTCTNTFRVEAQNVPASATAFSLRTRIRVADWGSTIADPNAPWIDFGIPPDIFVNPGPFPNPPWQWAQAGTTVDIDYTCGLSGSSRYCPALPGSSQQHQCMLVEIAPSPAAMGAPGFNIAPPAAVYRNMDFGTLSSLHEPATISLKGLQKVTKAARDRDVYIYLDTRNMPPHAREPREIPQKPLEVARAYAIRPPPAPRPNPNAGKRDAAVAGNPPGLLDLPLLTGDQALTQAYPTYRVFVYYDSGETVTVKGKVQKLLVPMVPFGFYLNHVGPFFGFNHSLEFLSGGATEIAPNFWVIHVANEGEVKVRTNVTAEEQPPGFGPPPVEHGHHCNCDIVGVSPWSPLALGLAGLGASALALRARRRRR
jgi:hypothetical protein